MTGPQLKSQRESRGWTQTQLSEFLGDSTPGTVSRWEKGVHEIPQWVEDKMLNSTSITLPLESLQALMSQASSRRQDFAELLSTAIRHFLDEEKQQQKEKLAPGSDSEEHGTDA